MGTCRMGHVSGENLLTEHLGVNLLGWYMGQGYRFGDQCYMAGS